MAIDSKFINAGISDDVLQRVNKKRKRRSPRPWDTPSSDNKETIQEDKTPEVIKNQGADTVPAQSRSNTGTMPIESRHNAESMPEQSQHNAESVPKQYRDKSRHNTSNVSVLPKNKFEELQDDYIYSTVRAYTGLKRDIIIYLCENSIDIQSEVLRNTSYNELSNILKIKTTSIRTTLKRIKNQDKLIDISVVNKGPGSRIDIILTPNLITNYRKLVKDRIIVKNNTDTSKDTKTDTNPSSSSSSNYFKEETTITRPKILDDIDIQWDIESLELHEGQINQLITLLNQGRVTESLFRLTLSEVAFHKENGGEFKKNPISALFHGLRTGHGFKSTIREEIEEKRKAEVEKQLIEKQKAEEARIQAEYQPWRDSLSDEEKTEILKRFNALDRTEQIQEVMLRNHFKRSI